MSDTKTQYVISLRPMHDSQAVRALREAHGALCLMDMYIGKLLLGVTTS